MSIKRCSRHIFKVYTTYFPTLESAVEHIEKSLVDPNYFCNPIIIAGAERVYFHCDNRKWVYSKSDLKWLKLNDMQKSLETS